MRILAIRGENLASLAEPFEIAFDAEPLAAAGLFAITGETGAGKSTLLDALCLALYDEFPRVKAAGSNEAIPDGDNGALSATDPRTILRRGAGRGFAEVDFVARDGDVYRARCDLVRAHGKASGALQARRRTLCRVAPDGTLEQKATDIRGVKAEIEALTDLTCEQFRRTVLLAQGDFDAFLRADAKERAELLEKITGTQVYADVSRRAYERWKAERDRLLALENRRAAIGLLAPEERAAREAALAGLAERRREENAAREALEALLRRHEAIAAAAAKRDATLATRDAARADCDALADERAHLAALDAVEPLRGAWEKVEACAEEADAARRMADESAASLEVARVAREAADGALAAAGAAVAEAEAACARFEPVWTEAEALDRRIVDAQERLRALATAREAAEEAARDAARAAAAVAERIAAAEAEQATLAADLVRDAALAPLATRFGELSDALARRVGFVADAADLRRREATARADLARIGTARARLDEADAADASVRDACAARLTEKAAAAAALGEAAVAARAGALETADGLVRRLIDAAEKAEAASAARAAATARREEAVAAFTRARDNARVASAESEALAGRADEVERLGALAEATASESARRLRAALVPGEPCPVCGVPHAEREEAEPDEFVAGIRARREALRLEQDAVRTRLAEAKAESESAERIGREAAAAIEAESGRLAAAESAWNDAGQAWLALPPLDLPEPPDAWRGAGPALAGLAEDIDAARAACRATLSRAQALRRDIEAERARRDAAVEAIEARRADRAALDGEESAARETIARAQARVPELEDRRASVDREWAGVLAACDVTPEDLDRDPAAARVRLAARAEVHAGRARRGAELAQALDADRPALAAAREKEAGKAEALAAAEAAQASAGTVLEGLRLERAALLDGQETPAHRARHRSALLDAKSAHESAREASDATRRAHAVAEATLVSARERALRAAGAHEQADEAFAAALAARGLDRATTLSLLAVEPAVRETVRSRLDKAAEALRDATSAHAHCEAALAEAIGAGAPEEDVATLVERGEGVAARLAALDEESVAHRVALQTDDAARLEAGALAAEIAAAAEVERLWAQMREAIGSADGSKFRTFAQSLTLEHLVALANRHLASLAPRYRLERTGGEGADLGLQIVDRDLGDERRSTRSLSGGERFLTSLALALALCSLEGRGSFVDTLFIDEGFGTLDAATLDVAIDALEALQAQGRKVGVISHVESMHQRIPVQIRVETIGGGRSRVRIIGAGALGRVAAA